MQNIRILTTGGTFDKRYDPIKGELVFKNSHLMQIIEDAKLNYNVEIESITAIDSLYMTDELREKIAQKCFDVKEEKIIIIHGTDTMVETSKFIHNKCKNQNKTIILTGAMVPFALENSDALFNLGFAFCAIQMKNKGTYITMGGQIFDYDNVIKNREIGKFEEKK